MSFVNQSSNQMQICSQGSSFSRHSYDVRPSKHAGSDPEAFWLRPAMTITASVQPESARIVYTRSDFPHPFQFLFSKDGMDHTAQNRTGSDVDGLVSVWPNTSGPEAGRYAGITRPGFWQDAAGSLPVSRFQTRLRSSTNIPDDTVQNQPGSDLVLADCVRFWPNGSGPEASQCARIIRPGSGQWFPADGIMRMRSSMFTRVDHSCATASSTAAAVTITTHVVRFSAWTKQRKYIYFTSK